MRVPAVLVFLVIVVGYGFWFYTIAKIAQQEPIAGGRRTFWLLFVVVTQFIGAGIYWLQRRWDSRRRAAVP